MTTQRGHPEREIENAIHELLNTVGFICLHTSAHTRRINGQHVGNLGTDKGVPDLLVTHHLFPQGVWIGLEVKTASGKLTAEQQNLLDMKRIYVVRGIADAARAITDYVLLNAHDINPLPNVDHLLTLCDK